MSALEITFEICQRISISPSATLRPFESVCVFESMRVCAQACVFSYDSECVCVCVCVCMCMCACTRLQAECFVIRFIFTENDFAVSPRTQHFFDLKILRVRVRTIHTLPLSLSLIHTPTFNLFHH